MRKRGGNSHARAKEDLFPALSDTRRVPLLPDPRQRKRERERARAKHQQKRKQKNKTLSLLPYRGHGRERFFFDRRRPVLDAVEDLRAQAVDPGVDPVPDEDLGLLDEALDAVVGVEDDDAFFCFVFF